MKPLYNFPKPKPVTVPDTATREVVGRETVVWWEMECLINCVWRGKVYVFTELWDMRRKIRWFAISEARRGQQVLKF